MSAWLSQLHFLRPLWLLGLLALPLLLLWLWRDGRRQNPWQAVVDDHLLAALLEPGQRPGGRLPLLLSMLLAGLALVALAGPAYRQLPQPLQRNQAALVIALDLSAGMLAGDLAPDRLTRARFAIADLLRLRRDGQTALIAYAGDAFTVAPLTDDAATLENLLGALAPDVMPEPGQRLDRAIDLAAQLLGNAGLERGQLLVLSHAADAAAWDAAQRANMQGLRISVLGIGSTTGAPVPLPGGGFWKDARGQLVLAKLQRDALRQLAERGGGGYAELGASSIDFDRLGLLETAQGQGGTFKELPRYRDEGPLLVLLMLPLAALLFRRGWLLGCALLLGNPPSAQAFDWDALWLRDDQRAWRALQAEEYDRARQLAPDPALRGSAAYKAGDFAAAAEAFATTNDAESQYNRGNALARAGELEAALAAYDAALERNPALKDAKFNRELVQQALQQRQQASQPQAQSGQGDEQAPQASQSAPEDAQQAESKSDSSPGQDGQQTADAGQPPDTRESPDTAQAAPTQPEQSERDAETAAAAAKPEQAAAQEAAQEAHRQALEQALQQAEAEPKAAPADSAQPTATPLDPAKAEARQAAEQWLQRVPDDPGGLLRRKFALEQRRRQQEQSNR